MLISEGRRRNRLSNGSESAARLTHHVWNRALVEMVSRVFSERKGEEEWGF